MSQKAVLKAGVDRLLEELGADLLEDADIVSLIQLVYPEFAPGVQLQQQGFEVYLVKAEYLSGGTDTAYRIGHERAQVVSSNFLKEDDISYVNVTRVQ